MTGHTQLINKLTEMGYEYVSQGTLAQIYCKKRTMHYVNVPRRAEVDEENCRFILACCGCSEEEIEGFISSCKS